MDLYTIMRRGYRPLQQGKPAYGPHYMYECVMTFEDALEELQWLKQNYFMGDMWIVPVPDIAWEVDDRLFFTYEDALAYSKTANFVRTKVFPIHEVKL